MTDGAAAIRVLLVEDHELYRQGLDEMLRTEGFNVIGQAGRGDDGVALALRARPDVVIMDLNLPGLGGAEATRRIVEQAPEVRIMVLTISTGSVELLDALLAGARGYLVKGAPLTQLVRGVRAVAAGELLVSRSVADEVLDRVRRGTPGGSAVSRMRPAISIVSRAASSSRPTSGSSESRRRSRRARSVSRSRAAAQPSVIRSSSGRRTGAWSESALRARRS